MTALTHSPRVVPKMKRSTSSKPVGKTRLSFRVRAGYLRATCRGEYPSSTYREMLAAIRDKARRSKRSRILIDAFALPAPAKEFDRIWVGEAIAQIFGTKFKLAILFKPELINKLAEHTAVGLGARVLVTGDEGFALEWLMD